MGMSRKIYGPRERPTALMIQESGNCWDFTHYFHSPLETIHFQNTHSYFIVIWHEAGSAYSPNIDKELGFTGVQSGYSGNIFDLQLVDVLFESLLEYSLFQLKYFTLFFSELLRSNFGKNLTVIASLRIFSDILIIHHNSTIWYHLSYR
jgi:hypothetical protein